MMKLPQARNTNIVEQELGKELLIYDLTANKAYQLNETSKVVFNACENGRSFDDLKREHQFSDELIYLALDALQKENLLGSNYEPRFTGPSRREVIRKVGLASLIALPVVVALVAPTAAIAASLNCGCAAPLNLNARTAGCACVSNDDCCGVCLANGGAPVCSNPTVAAQPNAAACCPALIV